MAKTHVEVIAAERVVYSGEADIVVAPGAAGQLGILPRHAPLLTQLVPGDLVIRDGSQETVLAVGGGFMEVDRNRVVVLADSAERADEIDIARAEEAIRRARAYLAERGPTVDAARAEAGLSRAIARMRAVERARRRVPRAPRAQTETPQ